MADSGYIKNVGLVGSVSLLITSITGPGLVLIPLIYQQAGWVVPTILFVAVGFLAGLAALFVVESTTRFPGNENFERNVEFTVMVHQFYGRRWYKIFLFILYGSLQSTNVASIIGSAQIFDSLFVGLFGSTCGWGISPISGLYCVNEVTNTNSPFGDNYMFGTLGLLVTIGIIVPLTQIDLNDNMLLQLVSLVYNGIFIVTLFGVVGGKNRSDLVTLPAVGTDLSQVVGQVLYNYALANTVPSWMNVKHPKTPPKKSVWLSISIAFFMYVMTGFIGGIGYPQNSNTNLLQAMYSDSTISGGGHGWVTFIYVLFPALTYISSIPVNMIVVRLNLLAAKVATGDNANWWAVWFPFIICIPMQTGNFITYFGTYTSITFQSLCNFFAPFLIFAFLSRRNLEMAQSVLDELEFLDISAGVKKSGVEDDDFDYIYHLPTANPDQIIWRDPFKKIALPEKKSKSMAQSMSRLSQHSRHSVKEIKQMLDPSLGAPTASTKHRQSVLRRRGTNAEKDGSDSQMGRRASKKMFGSTFSLNADKGDTGSVAGSSQKDSYDFKDIQIGGDIGDDDLDQLIPAKENISSFRAMPDFMYRYFNPNHIAIFSFLCMLVMVLQVAIGQ